jgi:hypothetical protein
MAGSVPFNVKSNGAPGRTSSVLAYGRTNVVAHGVQTYRLGG